eukprot:689303_1
MLEHIAVDYRKKSKVDIAGCSFVKCQHIDPLIQEAIERENYGFRVYLRSIQAHHHESCYTMHNTIWFDHSFPDKPPRWTTVQVTISLHCTADIGAIQLDHIPLNGC